MLADGQMRIQSWLWQISQGRFGASSAFQAGEQPRWKVVELAR